MAVINPLAEDVHNMAVGVRDACVSWRLCGHSRAEVADALEALVSAIERLQVRTEFRRVVN